MLDLSGCKKIVLFGGGFDPPHNAHIELPALAMQAVHGDAVVYVPTGLHATKPHHHTTATHRLAMLRLALENTPHACVYTGEVDRAATHNQPTYTLDTLESLRATLGPKIEMRLLIGGDNLRIFDQWEHPQRVIELAEPLVMVRPPDTHRSLLASMPKGYHPNEWAPRLIDLPRIDVSSTQVRRLVSQHRPITGLVPEAVEAYILEHQLYL